jgi:holo-[acyl-carrier protein] synthase
MIQLCQGIDIVDVAKFTRIFTRHKSFVEDIFTEQEKEECMSGRNPHVHFAGRFAAKEACLKALGRGLTVIGIDSTLREIEVVAHRSGKPMLKLHGWAGKMSRKRGMDQLTVSISHSSNYAVATVILVGQCS